MPPPYAGLRVLDLSQGLAGPYCGMLLAHHGADVIKLEPPGGDWSRGLGTRYGSHTALDVACNRGKRSIVLDLKSAQGQQVARRMADACDVVIESFRPGVVTRLGLGYEQLRVSNPRVIYLSVSGFGQSGPYAARAGTDMVMQAFSGMMSLNRDADDKPNRVTYVAADTVSALFAFQAVSSALYGRRDSGQGAFLDVNLMQSCAAFLMPKLIEAALEGDTPRQLNAPAGSYRTADGWMIITLSKEAHFHALCRAIGRPELTDDARFASFITRADHVTELAALIQAPLLARTTAQWMALLGEHDVLCSPVNTLTDWMADPHVGAVEAARGMQVPGMGEVPIAAIPGSPWRDGEDGSWADAGEHSAQVLRDFGWTPAQIDALMDGGIVQGSRAGVA